MISTQVSKDGGDLDGERPSSKDDALGLLDKAYADAGKRGGDVFRNSLKDDNGLWGAVLYKDRMLHAASGAHANAVVAYYKEWLPPWRVAASSSRPSRKRS